MSTEFASAGLTAGQLNAIIKKLGGHDMALRFLRDELVVKADELKLIRRMTLAIGGVQRDELAKRLRGAGHSVSDCGRDLLSRISTLTELAEIELGWIAVRDLGFTKEPTTNELFVRVKEVGGLCPAEVGPRLRLAETDPPRGLWYWIAMEPVTDRVGDLRVFGVVWYDSGKPWLIADSASSGYRWDLGRVVVLVLRK